MNRDRWNMYKRYWYKTPEDTFDFKCRSCNEFIIIFEKAPNDLICAWCKDKK